MGFGEDAVPKISKFETQIDTLENMKVGLDPNVPKDADMLLKIDRKINNLELANLINPHKDMGTLGKGLVGAAALSVPATYLDAVQREKDMADVDPAALNPFYYTNPEEFQLSNVAAQPYYYPTLQTDFGVPVEDLPTDFIRSAEGGTVQLANGTKKHFPRRTGPINGPGTGKSDSIPAMLSDGEFVMTAEAVRNAGGGNRRKGAKRMYDTMKNLERRVA